MVKIMPILVKNLLLKFFIFLYISQLLFVNCHGKQIFIPGLNMDEYTDHVYETDDIGDMATDTTPIPTTTTTEPITTSVPPTTTTSLSHIENDLIFYDYGDPAPLTSQQNTTNENNFYINANVLKERFSFDETFFKQLGIDEETFFKELGLSDDSDDLGEPFEAKSADTTQSISTTTTTTTTNTTPTTTTTIIEEIETTTTTTTMTTTTIATTTTATATTTTVPSTTSVFTTQLQNDVVYDEPRSQNVEDSEGIDECGLDTRKKISDKNVCNMYYLCNNGTMHILLCPNGYLYSEESQDCDESEKVECGTRLVLGFDSKATKTTTIPTTATHPTTATTVIPITRIHTTTPVTMTTIFERMRTVTVTPRTAEHTRLVIDFQLRNVNGTLECPFGFDGYYADPEFCNVYHHCLGGVDSIDQCMTPLVWNDKKKMCDWQANTDCTDKMIPIAHGQKSFCSERADGKYKDLEFCNIFHHCVSGNDNLVRCESDMIWNENEKRCDLKSNTRCAGRILPADKSLNNSTFCVDKDDGLYPHQEYCNVYHVCESGSDNIRQCPNQLFWDVKSNRCEWPSKVECTGRRLVTLSTEATLFCLERKDGVYGDPVWCNIYHTCLSGIDYKTKCPENLIWSETKKGCDWSDTTKCTTGKLYRNATDTQTSFCTERQNGKFPHDLYCNRYFVCQNGKDSVFTCQNNLRYNQQREECDWAVNVQCNGKKDYMWDGIKDNFCKSKPDGNYEDPSYCNIFHQCQAAMDYPKRCSNRLMFNSLKGECDWEDQVDCRGKDKLIDTVGLESESKPDNNNDGKGRVTKFCMSKSNGNYGDLYYCNIYHNCHGGFDTVQYCANGLVWKQESNSTGTCDWPLTSNIANGVDCGAKKIFFVNKQSNIDIMTSLRSEFCITRGEGLFAHPRYCDMYIQCTAQAVAITMECGAGLIFNEQKHECDYAATQDNTTDSISCPATKQMLRPVPKADGTLIFNGTDVTGVFPTKFKCDKKVQDNMQVDEDWCNIYHVCADRRDNIFICPPGTVFNQKKQGCFDRFSPNQCGNSKYFKPQFKKLINSANTN